VVTQDKLFGTCCKDMRDALSLPEQRFLFVQEGTGVLFLTVGGVKTDHWLVRSSGIFLSVLRNATSNA
jgi:hypothetical protein